MGVKTLGISPGRKAERPPFAGVWFAGCSLSGEPESGCAGEGSTRSRQELTARQCRLLTSPVSGHTRALSPTLVLSAVVPSRHRCRRPANGHGRMATVVYASKKRFTMSTGRAALIATVLAMLPSISRFQPRNPRAPRMMPSHCLVAAVSRMALGTFP